MQYDMEAEDNIAVARTDLAGCQRASLIARAAEDSGASEVIDRLPDGMSQMLGRRFEGGVDLSGGEWQKIALARAWLRDAQIFVLDEPTAALDARSELEVFERFTALTEGKMAVLISHRFSTVKMADRIVVVKAGRIAEQGNHDQLIARQGLYASLFELQAASYR
jgi:ATP-binding cassette subfamily B protein